MAPGKRVGQILNISFDMAAWETLGSLANGATLVIRTDSIAETARSVDILIATPSILASLDARNFPNIEVVAVAGEPCPKALADDWSQNASFYNSCGPTEITIINTIGLYSPSKSKISIGRPLPNTSVYILDDDLEPVPTGTIGEMWVGGYGVTQGYLNNEALTRERYLPDPFLGGDFVMFRTRDLARRGPGGGFEHYGRTDDQVKIRGFRVELDAVSAGLERIPGVQQAVTIKLDARSLVSFVIPEIVDPIAAIGSLERDLPYYSIPELVIPLTAMPHTVRGKIDKRLLTQWAVTAQQNLNEQQAYSGGAQ